MRRTRPGTRHSATSGARCSPSSCRTAPPPHGLAAYEFGQSRVICRVHCQSDVDAGRTVGQAVLPRLHQDPEFVADMAAAKLEAKKARKHGPPAGRDCRAEAAALQATDPAQQQRQ